MFTTVPVSLHTPVLLQLLAMEQASETLTVSDLIGKALQQYLTQSPDERDASPRAPEIIRGYQWKSLFLPEGTILRSWSYGENNYARVEGDHIMHMGRSVSPNQFARSFSRTFRNAWIDLSVKRPGDKTYIIASRLRREILAQDKVKQDAACMLASAPSPSPPASPPPAPPPAPTPLPASSGTPPITRFGPPIPARPSLPMAPQTAPAGAEQLAALLTQTIAAAAQLGAASRPPGQVGEPGFVEPGDEWCLPERRKFRLRLEDADF
ncbi:hypothetical protein HSX11_12575 [Oxalobacteraceae bacterium]|nr:hypothetical protein [Oxalobacteraceae bacterium]